jgi:hypothetical protein
MPEDTSGQDPTPDAQDTSAEQQHSTNTTTATSANVQDTAALPNNAGGAAENELRRARDDAAKFRTALKDAQKQLKDAQDALQVKDDEGKSEMQKAMDKVAEQQARLQVAEGNAKTLRLQNEVMLKAQKLDIVDPDAAFRLLDKDSVDYDGDRPMNIGDLLEDLIVDRPYLKAQPNTRKQAAAPSNSSTTQPASKPGQLTMDDIEGMTSDEINERWAEVQPVLEAQGTGTRGTKHIRR